MQSLKTQNLRFWLIIYSLCLTFSETFIRRSNYCLKFLVLPGELLTFYEIYLAFT